jgi:hypothetical protein
MSSPNPSCPTSPSPRANTIPGTVKSGCVGCVTEIIKTFYNIN